MLPGISMVRTCLYWKQVIKFTSFRFRGLLSLSGWRAAVGAIVIAASPALTKAQPAVPVVQPEGAPLKSSKGFSFDEETRQSVSGIACAAEGTRRRCLVVFDEGREGQFANLQARSIEPEGNPFTLVASARELDAEGATMVGEHFYVIGSHSVKRKGCKSNVASRSLVRFKARWVAPAASSAAEGKPPSLKVEGLEQTGRLWDLISRDPYLGRHADGCLGAGNGGRPEQMQRRPGLNIEGIAALGDRLYVGFRSPSEAGVVPVYSVAAPALFALNDAKPKLLKIQVGSHLGIRDMVAGKSAILLLLGPDDHDPVGDPKYLVAEWRVDDSVASSTQPKVLAVLDLTGLRFEACFKELKPEALSILEETAMGYRIVVLSDGVFDGGPLIFHLSK